MPIAAANPVKIGRALTKGGFLRALFLHWPIILSLAATLGGGAMVAKALYIPIKAEVAQVMLTRAFTQSVETGAPVKPWSWADTAPVAKVSAERLGVSEIVLSGGSGEAMAFGPTALVDDRARGLTILAAHRDTHFTFVRDLEVGDTITLSRIDGSDTQYAVTAFETVRWDEFSYPTHGADGLLALTTCYPFDTHEPGPLRRIVWAERVKR